MAIFVTFKTKDTMKSFFILLSLYYFLVVNVVSADSVTFPSRVEIVMDEDFDLPGGPGNAHRSIPSATPFLAYLFIADDCVVVFLPVSYDGHCLFPMVIEGIRGIIVKLGDDYML